MRKSMIMAVFAAAALGGVAGCAHPHEAPLPGESTSQATSPVTTTSSTDETKSVCSEATSTSTSAVTTLKTKLNEGKAALAANNQAGALVAANEARNAAKQWSSKLSSLASRPIKSSVRTVLTDGVTMIDTLAASTNINPTDAESKLNDFTSKLAIACA